MKEQDNFGKSKAKKKKQFWQSHSQYMKDINGFIEGHKRWRSWTKNNKKGFFVIYPEFSEITKNVSGNAIKLYLFLATHTDNTGGYTLVSVDTMANHFETNTRTVHIWLKELRDHKLIVRVQPGFKQTTLTFLLPYHEEFLYSGSAAIHLDYLIQAHQEGVEVKTVEERQLKKYFDESVTSEEDFE